MGDRPELQDGVSASRSEYALVVEQGWVTGPAHRSGVQGSGLHHHGGAAYHSSNNTKRKYMIPEVF